MSYLTTPTYIERPMLLLLPYSCGNQAQKSKDLYGSWRLLKLEDIRVEIRLRKARICKELEAAQAEGHSSGDQAQKSKDL